MAEAKEQKITKQFILNHLEDSEVDLSLCYLITVPVKELVSIYTVIGALLTYYMQFYRVLLLPAIV